MLLQCIGVEALRTRSPARLAMKACEALLYCSVRHSVEGGWREAGRDRLRPAGAMALCAKGITAIPSRPAQAFDACPSGGDRESRLRASRGSSRSLIIGPSRFPAVR